ncbi:MAG: hypothetical protein USCAAHI_00084 [Beijerinckiaceae bacterium]|nr:MAG: hypothetical protein USCAAHI_00084 [Beijerinckiaceae bacterium]
MSRRQTEGGARNPHHEPGQPAVGCSPDPWRTPQARHRCWSNLGRQIHGKAQETPISRLEDVPPQPRRWDCIDGPVCRSDTLVFRVLYGLLILRHGRRQILAGSNGTPDCRMDCQVSHRSLRLGTHTELATGSTAHFSPGGFRAMGIRDRPTAPQSPWQNGHTERLIGSIRGECLDHVVVFGERHLHHILLILYGVLQRRPDTFISEQGCAGTAGCSGFGRILPIPFSADYTISMFGFDFRHGTPIGVLANFLDAIPIDHACRPTPSA